MISTPLHRRLGAEHRVNGRAQSFRGVDNEQAPPCRIDAVPYSSFRTLRAALAGVAVFAARDRGAVVIAGVLKKQLESAKNLGVAQIVALDDPAAFRDLQQVDVVANTVRGKTAEDLLGKVKDGGTFASVTGAPSNAGNYPRARTVAFVSKQDTKNLEYTVEAVRAGKLTIPVGSKLPLRNAAEAHAALAKGGIGKILLLP
jgi:NADPH:quinone reductase-like Zn-dependent oxidoreductase